MRPSNGTCHSIVYYAMLVEHGNWDVREKLAKTDPDAIRSCIQCASRYYCRFGERPREHPYRYFWYKELFGLHVFQAPSTRFSDPVTREVSLAVQGKLRLEWLGHRLACLQGGHQDSDENSFGINSLAWAKSPLISVEETIRHPIASLKA